MTMKHASGLAVCALAGAVLAGAGPAGAQNTSLEPNFGSATLSAGFEPDPHVMNLVAGGDIDASGLADGCVGHISDAPDYRITYTASAGLKLTIRVRSAEDTTLVVNGPAGRWLCNDDAGNGINPGVVYRTPASGVYDIWVGTFGETPAEAQLRITELE